MSANLMASLLLPSHATLNREPHLPHGDPGVPGVGFENLLADFDQQSAPAPTSAPEGDKSAGLATQRAATSTDPNPPASSSPDAATNVDAALALLATVVFPLRTQAAPTAATRTIAQSRSTSGPSPAPLAARLSVSTASAPRTPETRLAEALKNQGSIAPTPEPAFPTTPTTFGESAPGPRTASSTAAAWPFRSNPNVKMPDLGSLIDSASARAMQASGASAIVGPTGGEAKAAPGAALGTLAYVKTSALDFAPELGFQSLQTRTHLAVSSVESSAAANLAQQANDEAGAAMAPAATKTVPPAQTYPRRIQTASVAAAAITGLQRQAHVEAGTPVPSATTKTVPPAQAYLQQTQSAPLATPAAAGVQRQAHVEAGTPMASGTTNPAPSAQTYPGQAQTASFESAAVTGLQRQANVRAAAAAPAAAMLPAATNPVALARAYVPEMGSTSVDDAAGAANAPPGIPSHLQSARPAFVNNAATSVLPGQETFASAASALTVVAGASPRAQANPQAARSTSVNAASVAGLRGSSTFATDAPPTLAANAVPPVQPTLAERQSAPGSSGGEGLGPLAPAADVVKAPQTAQATVAPVLASASGAGANVVNLSDLGERLVHEAQGFAASDVQTNGPVAASPVKELRLNLEPAHLGAVAVTLKMTSGKLSVDVGVANPNSLAAVESQRDAMMSKLQAGAQPLDSFVVHQQIFSDASFSQASSNPSQAESFGNTSGNDKSSPGAEGQTPRQPRTPPADNPSPAGNSLGDGLVV